MMIRLKFIPEYFPILLLPLYWLYYICFYLWYLPFYLIVIKLLSPYKNEESLYKYDLKKTTKNKREFKVKKMDKKEKEEESSIENMEY